MSSMQGLVDKALDMLARNCHLEDSSDLFSIELSTMLDELKEDFEDWDKSTPDRFIFDLLVRRSKTAVVDYWETILEIMAANCDNEKDVELHIDMLALIEHLLSQKNLHSTIIFYGEIILRMIIFPSLSWKSGNPSQKIRKASIICLIKIMDEGLIEPKKMYGNFKDCTQRIKGCLDDDWANDLRWSSLIALRNFMVYVKDDLAQNDFIEFYAEILKRLDDAQDQIRLETCKTLEVMFDLLPEYWSSSLYPYTIKAIFIHLDDPNHAIQMAITAVLKKAARVQTKDFVEVAEECYNKHAHPVLCKNLLDYASENFAIN